MTFFTLDSSLYSFQLARVQLQSKINDTLLYKLKNKPNWKNVGIKTAEKLGQSGINQYLHLAVSAKTTLIRGFH